MQRRRLTYVLVMALAGCGTPEPPSAPQPQGDNSRNALDWAGAYVGTLPCADCPGIRTRVELRDDGTFSSSVVYLGENVPPVEATGTFEWDSSGSRITLALGPGDAQQQYQVGENVLFPVDRNGQRITGERADLYRLEKVMNDPSIENRRWQLVELNGRPVEAPADREGAYLELDSAQARVTGRAPCNSFFGTYDLTSGSRLQFGPNMGSTMMACPELDLEREFFEALARVDNYTISEGMLSLNRARMAPLARFRAGAE
jgi:copper homeostasis protein (lipoprotein)